MSATVMHDGPTLRTPFLASALLHATGVALFFVMRSAPAAAPAPSYRVNLVAAPPGERQIGVVQPAPEAAPVTPAPAPVAAATPEPARLKAPAKKPAARAPKVATPNAAAVTPPAAAPVKAGGGPEGGKGADVANVKIDGPAFPYQGYLDNIVRRIAVEFKPKVRGALQAEVAFLIRRDGSVAGLRLTKRSGVYSFDEDAKAAVELASSKFGALPSGYADDVLPVIFSFDPRLIR
ncbi:MAG: TonB C-terminal domain-containing protein [Gemmatimonadota bacterium]